MKLDLRRVLGAIGFGAGLTVAATFVAGALDTLAATGGNLGLVVALFNRRLLFLAALATLLLVVGWRLAFGSRRAETSPGAALSTPPSAAPVPIPSDEVESEEGEVTACLRCGSEAVAPSTLDDGMVLGGGETLLWVCRRCSWRGQPLTFTDPTAYRQFVRGLHEAREEPRES